MKPPVVAVAVAISAVLANGCGENPKTGAEPEPAAALDDEERDRLQREGERVALQAELAQVREKLAQIDQEMRTTLDEPYFAVLERTRADLRARERELERALQAATDAGADTAG